MNRNQVGPLAKSGVFEPDTEANQTIEERGQALEAQLEAINSPI